MRSFCIPEFGLSAACFFGVDRHIRRGGGGWDEGRGRLVLCVAQQRGAGKAAGNGGDASVPSPHNPTPAPTNKTVPQNPLVTYS